MSKFDGLQQINTNTPRETIAYNADGLVVKVSTGRTPNWLSKQQHAHRVTTDILNIPNRPYFVPSTMVIDGEGPLVLEQRAYGHPITSSYFETLSPRDRDVVYHAVASLMNDMNQMRPVLSQKEFFDQDGDLNTILRSAKFLSREELEIVRRAKEWFDNAAATDASVVFSHGDMNENNIFYDPASRTVSFIDFADAKYENAHYMFERNFGRLGWLDLDRLRHEYMALPRTQPVVITTDNKVENMRILLQNLKWSVQEYLNNMKRPAANVVRMKIIRDNVDKISKLYSTEKFVTARGAMVAAKNTADATAIARTTRRRQK